MQPRESSRDCKKQDPYSEVFPVLSSLWALNARLCAAALTPGTLSPTFPSHLSSDSQYTLCQSQAHILTAADWSSVHFKNSFCSPARCGPREDWAGNSLQLWTVFSWSQLSRRDLPLTPPSTHTHSRIKTPGVRNYIKTHRHNFFPNLTR